MSVDFGCIAWHEDGRWSANSLASTRDIGSIIDSLKAQQTNGGAIALIAIEDEFVIIARMLGDQMQMMISDVTYALDYEVAAELIEVLDLEFPEEEDEEQPGGDLDLLNDLITPLVELYKTLYELDKMKILDYLKCMVNLFKLDKENVEGYNQFRRIYNENLKCKEIHFQEFLPLDFFLLICHSFNNQIRFNKK